MMPKALWSFVFPWAAVMVCLTATCQAGSFVVELAQPTSRSRFLASHPHATLRHEYDSPLFHGVSIDLDTTDILSHPDIVRVWPVTATAAVHSAGSVSHMEFEPESPSTIPQLTKYYAEMGQKLGVNGSGFRIGLIDSGVDYRHPALGGCFGPGCPVAYGADLVGDNYDGSPESIVTSNDPLDDCPRTNTTTGHGTFLAGILAAQDTRYASVCNNWTGVAPGASLGMWRVYGCDASKGASTDVLLKAMEMAYKAGMDIINLSFGNMGGWGEDVLSVYADRLTQQGIHVVAASGNIGTSGAYLAAAPATGRHVIATGATVNNYVPAYLLNVQAGNQSVKIPYRSQITDPIHLQSAARLVSASETFGGPADACNNLDDKTFNGTAVLIHQGQCGVHTQIHHAARAGAVVALVYTDTTSTTTFEVLDNPPIPVAFINWNDGQRVFNMTGPPEAQVHFTKWLVALAGAPQELNRVASFSSVGPTNELDLKPELCATGGNVFSTLPLTMGGYGFASGTSMAAPVVSGAIALFLEATARQASPEDVKTTLMNFARPLRAPITTATENGDSPIRQGAGLLDVVRAVQGFQTLQVTPSKLSFNDTEHAALTQTLTITNRQSQPMTITLRHGPSLTVIDYDSQSQPMEPIQFDVTAGTVADMHFEISNLTLPANSTRTIQLRVSPPHLSRHAVYGGYIGIETPTITAYVPYIGVQGRMRDLAILDRSSSGVFPFPSIGNPNGKILDEHATGNYSDGLWPTVLVRLLTGTSQVVLEVRDTANQTLGVVPYDPNGPNTRAWLPRNTRTQTVSSNVFHSWLWAGQYIREQGAAETATVPSGVYRLVVRALRVFGNPSSPNDWDTWVSPQLNMTMDKPSKSTTTAVFSTSTLSSTSPTMLQ